ncbi:MAG: polysaccharide deacetylase family protein [Candidatus Doudnabacteria bacterium]|nr:polysaccharide deacetylase family protein [Candidatus Doudnabacteria bacterium]
MQQLDLFDYHPSARRSRWNLSRQEIGAIVIFVLAIFFAAQPEPLPALLPKDLPAAPIAAEARILPTATAPTITQLSPKQLPQSFSVPVLMYHHVKIVDPYANALDRNLTVSPSDFEQQVKYFAESGFQSVTLGQVSSALSAGASLPAKPIVFTFDDGYEDVFINAVPILQKYNYVGSFAVVPGFFGFKGYASWDQVKAAADAGMELVSHTMHHIDLTNRKYSFEDLMVELEGSKLFLESRINKPVDVLIYPYGKYDQRAMEAARKAGYKIAFTTEFGTNISLSRAYASPRVRVHGIDGLAKLKKLLGRQIAVSRQGP